jgi:hypothetical protein
MRALSLHTRELTCAKAPPSICFYTEAQNMRALFVKTFAARLAPAHRKRALQRPQAHEPTGALHPKI